MGSILTQYIRNICCGEIAKLAIEDRTISGLVGSAQVILRIVITVQHDHSHGCQDCGNQH